MVNYIYGPKYFNVFETIAPQSLACRNAENDLVFDPPVYKQRYGTICEIITNPKWKNQIAKIVDFGCSEFGFFLFLKHLLFLREIIFVDIDEDLLNDNLYKLTPLIYDFIHRRPHEFNLNIFKGSVAFPDSRLKETDVVTAIELIEHLYPDCIEGFTYNVFGYIRPKLVIITTPNKDFNVLFNWYRGHNFRHDDHKFEWTREEFKDWTENIIQRFPNYTLAIGGIGCGPINSEQYGCCSQIAVFTRKDIILKDFSIENVCTCCYTNNCPNWLKEESLLKCFCKCNDCQPRYSFGICTHCSYSTQDDVYKCLNTIEYPFEIDNRTEEEKIMETIECKIRNFGYWDGPYFDYERNISIIPINHLGFSHNGHFIEGIELEKLLRKFGYKISEDCTNNEKKAACVIYIPEMNSDSEKDESSGCDLNNQPEDTIEDIQIIDNAVDIVEESWDDDCDNNQTIRQNCSEACGIDIESWDNVNKNCSKNNETIDQGTNNPINDPGFNNVTQNKQSNKIKNQSDDEESSNESKNNKNSKKISEIQAICGSLFRTPTIFPRIEVVEKIYVSNPVAGPSNKPPTTLTQGEEEAKYVTDCVLWNCLNKIDVGSRIQFGNNNDNSRLMNVLNISKGEKSEKKAETTENQLDVEENPQQVQLEHVLNYVVDSIEANGDNTHNNDRHEADSGPLEVNVVPLTATLLPPPTITLESVQLDSTHTRNNLESLTFGTNLPQEAMANETLLDIERSSREALCTNSHVDLLEEDNLDEVQSFPDWLLEMFNDIPLEQQVEGDRGEQDDNGLDFYSQGDGVGVHPSVETLEDETESSDDDDFEDDDGAGEDEDSSSSTLSSNTQVLFELPQPPHEDTEDSTDNLIVLVNLQNTNDQQTQNVNGHETDNQSTDNIPEV